MSDGRIRCPGSVWVSVQSLNIFLEGYDHMVQMNDSLRKIVVKLMMSRYLPYLDRFKEAIDKMYEVAVTYEDVVRDVCGKITKPSRFRYSGVRINWDEVIANMRTKVMRCKDAAIALELLYDMLLSLPLRKRYLEMNGFERLKQAVVEALDTTEWIIRWLYNVANVVRRSLQDIIVRIGSRMESVIYKVEIGKMSEDRGEKIVEELRRKFNVVWSYMDTVGYTAVWLYNVFVWTRGMFMQLKEIMLKRLSSEF